MKLQVLSDVHVEFYSQGKANKLIRSLVNPEADALIIAGDFGVGQSSRYTKHLNLVCELWPEVFFVTGNHDYWQTSEDVLCTKLTTVGKDHSNFHWLNGSSFQLGDFRIFGATLWYKVEPGYPTWCDYLTIPNGMTFIETQEIVQSSQLMVFLLDSSISNVQKIVVTHHMPSYKSVDIRYTQWDTNRFFVNDMEDLIQHTGPNCWIHGHTHSSQNYTIGRTQILCNPMGYPHEYGLENSTFDKDLYIGV